MSCETGHDVREESLRLGVGVNDDVVATAVSGAVCDDVAELSEVEQNVLRRQASLFRNEQIVGIIRVLGVSPVFTRVTADSALLEEALVF